MSTKYGNKGFLKSPQRDVSLDLLLDDSFEERTSKRDVAYYASKAGALLGTVTFIGIIIAIPVLTGKSLLSGWRTGGPEDGGRNKAWAGGERPHSPGPRTPARERGDEKRTL